MALPDESFSPEAKPAAAAALRVVRGPQTGVSIQLGDAPQTIGRSPQRDVFLNDMTVSREHASVEPADGGKEAFERDPATQAGPSVPASIPPCTARRGPCCGPPPQWTPPAPG